MIFFWVYREMRHSVSIFAKKILFDKKFDRIQSPDGVRDYLHGLWLKHKSGEKSTTGQVFWVDLPEPTEEEKRIMAENRANRKPVIIVENTLQSGLNAALEKLGGW